MNLLASSTRLPNPQSTAAYVHAVSLSAGARVRVYDSPSIAKVLETTGKLVEAAGRRIEETGKWLNQAMLPGVLRVGENGYVAPTCAG